ncbi:MAG TPA: nitric-oxide reductase large subunit, partial [Gammaproteobacteria bacterium]
MSTVVLHTDQSLSPWWGRAVAVVMVIGFAALITLSIRAYEDAPPIPARVLAPDGTLIFSSEDVANGQAVFLKYGLMNNGTIWGHGGMLGPDFSAQTLHNLGLFHAERIAQARYSTPYADLGDSARRAVDGAVAAEFKHNTYDPGTGVLTLPEDCMDAFQAEVGYWTEYFRHPATSGGLARDAVSNPEELRALTAFFMWTAWAAAAERPGYGHSYTNNFPYDPLVGNHPTGATVLWSAVSLLFLLGGTGIVLLAFGKFDYLGWHQDTGGVTTLPDRMAITPAQAATLKFMLIAAALFLVQTLVGGAVAHYRAEPGDFYGFDLSAILPSNLLRGWHLQLAVFWVATAYVAGALFVASALGGRDPKAQRPLVHGLFWALVIVVVGSLLGQWAGIKNQLGELWFWLGNQGWEYLEIGRFWQVLLAAGLLYWFALVFRAVRPALDKPETKPFVVFFLIAAFAIPFFYLPAFFIGAKTHYSIVDVWRFWIIHLWV